MKPASHYLFLMILAPLLLTSFTNDIRVIAHPDSYRERHSAFAPYPSTPTLHTPNFTIDVKKSKVNWTGYYLFEFGEHRGTIEIIKGNLQTADNEVTGGSFELDMKSIRDVDMPKDDGGKDLETHLMSKDFFDVDNFPTAQFQITKTEKIKEARPGQPNVDVFGDLTIKGVKNGIKFPALVTINENGVTAKARFKFDRTKWEIKYNSGKFFADAGDGAISDAIAIEIDLLTSK